MADLKIFILLLFLVLIQHLNAQSENIPVSHPIYSFLKKVKTEGFLNGVEFQVIPMSKSRIKNILDKLESSKESMKHSDQEELEIYRSYFEDKRFGKDTHQFNLKKIDKLLFDDSNVSLYHFKKEEFDLKLNPVFSARNILVDKNEEQIKSSFLISYGGELILNYSDWLGIYISAYNGVNLGDREVAKSDKRVNESFSFKYTKINYFDGTEGFIQLQNGFAKFQAGRERVLWGVGNINKATLDYTPQLFDFIKLDLAYDVFSFNFLHGWMVEKSDTLIVPGSLHEIRTKPSKYFAVSRFGVSPLDNLSLGISQSVVYAERPFELSYLNPFLFWESAQRSMNDLDNSFLTFDITYYPINGIQINSTFVMDDINFEFYFSDKWNHKNNRNLWQAGVQFTHPILPSQMSFTIEYIQIRPFTFSHPGLQTGLAYTNNGAILSADIEPNSALLSINLAYSLTPRLSVSFLYENYIHGKNILDSSGNLMKNVGGDIFESYSVFTDERAKFLDGDLEVENRYTLLLKYYLSAKINMDLAAKYVFHNYLLQNVRKLMIFSTISYNTYLF